MIHHTEEEGSGRRRAHMPWQANFRGDEHEPRFTSLLHASLNHTNTHCVIDDELLSLTHSLSGLSELNPASRKIGWAHRQWGVEGSTYLVPIYLTFHGSKLLQISHWIFIWVSDTNGCFEDDAAIVRALFCFHRSCSGLSRLLLSLSAMRLEPRPSFEKEPMAEDSPLKLLLPSLRL